MNFSAACVIRHRLEFHRTDPFPDDLQISERPDADAFRGRLGLAVLLRPDLPSGALLVHGRPGTPVGINIPPPVCAVKGSPPLRSVYFNALSHLFFSSFSWSVVAYRPADVGLDRRPAHSAWPSGSRRCVPSEPMTAPVYAAFSGLPARVAAD